ncbi:MAG: hypothetical protein KKD39_08310, partial [Candidatus Altiarchaeota archaeon]|nr:hypothetical protein [Candidatus Altiarchaeota archaeon]
MKFGLKSIESMPHTKYVKTFLLGICSIACVFPLFFFIVYSPIKWLAILFCISCLAISSYSLLYGCYLMVFFLPFSYVPTIFGENLYLCEIAVFAISSVFFLKKGLDSRPILKKTRLDRYMFLYMISSFFSVAFFFFGSGSWNIPEVINSQNGFFSLRLFGITVESFLAFFVGVNVLSKEKSIAILKPLLAGALLASVFSLYQFAVGVPRVTAFFHSSNFYGMYLAICIPASIHLFTKLKRRVYLMAFPFLFLSLFLTFSRASWIATFLSVFYYMALENSISRYLKILAVFFVVFPLLFYFFLETTYVKHFFYADTQYGKNILVQNQGENIVRIYLVNKYRNSEKQLREIIVSNVSGYLTQPRKVFIDGEITDCMPNCSIMHYGNYVEFLVDSNFSFNLKGVFVEGWPRVLVTLEEDNTLTRLREFTYFNGISRWLGGRVDFFGSRPLYWSSYLDRPKLG